MFTGGVGYYFYNPLTIRSVSDVSLHGDIGPLLAESFGMNAEISNYLF